MVKVIPNKNILLFLTIFYSILDTNSKIPKHKLALKVLEELGPQIPIDSSKNLILKYHRGLIDKNIYRYMRLALYSDKNLEPEKTLYGHYSYGKPLYTLYIKHLKSIFQEIKKGIDFDNYYEKDFLPEYKKICSRLQPFFDKNDFSKEFYSFWKLPFKPKLFLIPNVFSTRGGSGITKPQKYYSQTGAYLNEKNNTYEFIPEKVWFNSVHEFCHSAFKDSLVQTNNFKNYLEISGEKFIPIKDDIPQKILKTYNSGYAYFEDTFIRACRIKILENYYKRTDPNIDIDFFIKNSIKKQAKKNGFKFVEDFFNMLTLETEIPPADVYIKTLKSLKL